MTDNLARLELKLDYIGRRLFSSYYKDTGKIAGVKVMVWQYLVGEGLPYHDAGVYVVRRGFGDKDWCVFNGTSCLNTLGEWEYEPSPSNREDDFLARTRYTLEEAMAKATAYMTLEKQNEISPST